MPVFNSVFPRLFGCFVELAQFSGLRKGREIYGRTLIDSVFWEALIAVETKLTNPTSCVPRRCTTFCGLANTHGGSLSHLMANCWPNDTLGHCSLCCSPLSTLRLSISVFKMSFSPLRWNYAGFCTIYLRMWFQELICLWTDSENLNIFLKDPSLKCVKFFKQKRL